MHSGTWYTGGAGRFCSTRPGVCGICTERTKATAARLPRDRVHRGRAPLGMGTHAVCVLTLRHWTAGLTKRSNRNQEEKLPNSTMSLQYPLLAKFNTRLPMKERCLESIVTEQVLKGEFGEEKR